MIEDNRKLHLIPTLELQAILDFFYMEEQFLVLTNFIQYKTELGGKKKNKTKNAKPFILTQHIHNIAELTDSSLNIKTNDE